MAEELKRTGWNGPGSAAIATVPNEPFPCPSCGQMLAPTCQVCVSCRRAIDPAAIRRPTLSSSAPVEATSSPPLVRVPFPWKLFFLVLFLTWVACVALAAVFHGDARLQVVLFSMELASSVWVLYDASQKRLPKPFRWAIATLLFWAFLFPWYLARRRVPSASVPFVEREPSRLSKLVLLGLCIVLILVLAFGTRIP